MGFRRWLVVGLCFCIFSGCKACQSYLDYCGPMPAEGGDFMYRKNSVLGGDPAMKRMVDEAPGEQGETAEDTGPEPTPAPAPDEERRRGMDMEGDRPTLAPENDEAADEAADDDLEVADDELDGELGEELGGPSRKNLDDEVARGERGGQPSASAVEWHAPLKKGRSPIRQVHFSAD